MVTYKMMKNSEIYTIANGLLETFQEEVSFPIRVNFYFQKNKNTIIEMAQEIERERMKIFETYGTKNEDGTQYSFAPEVVDKANQELTDLFDIEQEVKIYMLDIEAFGDIVLTTAQMNLITYMINDEEE